jgi:hypothetical protein
LHSDEHKWWLKELEIFRSSKKSEDSEASSAIGPHSNFISLHPETTYFCPPDKFGDFSFGDLIKRDVPYDELLLSFLDIKTLETAGMKTNLNFLITREIWILVNF